jgi:secretion/DNA translocation related TadE-like protein
VTVVAAVAAVVLLSVAAAGVELGGAAAVRHRAQAAADLGALAAAAAADRGSDAACRAARDVAGRMDATIDSCGLVGWDALVTAVVHARLPAIGAVAVAAVARAGPATDP